MHKYETMVVLAPNLSEDTIATILERITNIINEAGKVESVEEWGQRNLAYKIDNQYTEGYYVLINFEAETKVLPELEHLYKITDNIIRSIVINKEK